MSAPYEDYRKRTPHPAPNAFAVPARPKQETMEQVPTAHPSRSASPVPTSDEGLLRMGSHTSKDKGRHSAMTTFSNLMDQARGSVSPRKKEHHSLPASARSKHSERSYRSAVSEQARVEEADETTTRSAIEGYSEARFQKMMQQAPQTPTTQFPDDHVVTYDLRPKRSTSEVGGLRSTHDEPPKSPKKKLFGMSLPGFMSPSSNLPAPPMPSKAAKVLGARPAKPHQFKTPRSDTSASLPTRIYNQHSRVRQHYQTHVSTARSRQRVTSRKVSSPRRMVLPGNTSSSPVTLTSKDVQVAEEPASVGSPRPPTPPQKDTPPDVKKQARAETGRDAAASNDLYKGPDQHVPGPIQLQLPKFTGVVEAVPAVRGSSPVKYNPSGAEEYIRLIQGDRITSTHPVMDSVDDVESDQGISRGESDELFTTPRPGRSQSRDEKHSPSRAFVNSQNRAPPLLPAFFTPPKDHLRLSTNIDTGRFLFSIPPRTEPQHHREAGSVLFQSTSSEIDPNSETGSMTRPTMEEAASSHGSLNGEQQQEQASLRGGGGGNELKSVYISHSPYRLTEILRDLSSTATEFARDFNPNCPSAVPSPLHRVPGQQQLSHRTGPVPPAAPVPRVLGSPETLEDHFYMTNEHIDVLGRSLYDHFEVCSSRDLNYAMKNKTAVINTIEKEFVDIKGQLDSVNDKADRASEQTQNIHLKLDKLLEFIKAEVAEPLVAQTHKVKEMENNMKELQQTVLELQKAVGTQSDIGSNPYSGPSPSSHAPSASFALPTARSQPAFAGYHDGTMEASSNRLPFRAGRPDGQARYNNNYGQTWARPEYSRENKEGDSHPFSGASPYHIPNYPQTFGYHMPREGSDVHYNFNQGGSK
ncbi:hypothetical protein BDV95DRAFT_657601 [Massariosphaeria phaeospora]|uniref:Uncharacterized protein n=1 Tax=Massariosphaeria phaeospora TaxID=100035 RepID=A0A7C8IDN4_9PLEO|nr:hypothetical protein BDV95DRAFT_657601 [Massariosphaeria phaeospora]